MEAFSNKVDYYEVIVEFGLAFLEYPLHMGFTHHKAPCETYHETKHK
jgi:hypothetical protein